MLNDNMHPQVRTSDLGLLHPLAVKAFRSLDASLKSLAVRGDIPFEFRVFETYRTPQRQQFVHEQGTSRARQYQSAHQFGLAVDFVPWTKERGFFWDTDLALYSFLKNEATRHGLEVPLSWDRCHVEHPLWDKVRIAMWG